MGGIDGDIAAADDVRGRVDNGGGVGLGGWGSGPFLSGLNVLTLGAHVDGKAGAVIEVPGDVNFEVGVGDGIDVIEAEDDPRGRVDNGGAGGGVGVGGSGPFLCRLTVLTFVGGKDGVVNRLAGDIAPEMVDKDS